MKRTPVVKPTDFCSAVIRSRRVHFACMAPAVAVHAKRGFCKEHAPAFETFFLFRIDRGGEVEKVLVFQPPGSSGSFCVVSPSDKIYGSRVYGGQWHRTLKAAQSAPLTYALERVAEARRDLAARLLDLKNVRSAAR